MDTAQDTPDTGEIIQPDRRLTAIALVLPALAFALVWLARDYLTPLAAEWLRYTNAAQPFSASARTATVLLAILSVPALLCLLFASWTGLMAYRVFKTGVFPPKGYPILVKTRVRRDGAARREAVKFILSGIAALALLAYLCWSLFSHFPVLAALRG